MTARYPAELRYSPEHDWARIEGSSATFGVTWYAQDALGEIVFFDAPEIGAQTTFGESYAELESVKAVSDIVAPLSGEIVEINSDAVDEPSLINSSPYEGGWLIRVRIADASEIERLLDASAYQKLLAAG